MAFHTVILYSVVASVAYLAIMAVTAVVLALRQGGRREDPLDDEDALSVSRFTIPVSLIVPLRERAAGASAIIRSLLALNYPDFEVIVVAEHLPESEWEALKAEFGFEAKEFFYRQTLGTAAVKKIYRSARDARLMIVDKTPGPLADTLNCGVNLARFRYVSSVDQALFFDTNALLRAMSAPMRRPAAVAAASSHVETRAAQSSNAGIQGALQRLESVRALMDSRVAWRMLHAALGPRDAVVVWRRDAIVQLGGFSPSAADPDLDMMVRLQTSASPKIAGQFVRSAEIFGRKDPRPLLESMRLTARRQTAALQAIWTLVRSGAAVPFLYFAVSELVTPFLQAWVVLATTAGAAAGWFAWRDAAFAVVLLSLGNATISGAALLLRGSTPDAPDGLALKRLLLLAPIDFVVSGTAAACARSVGFCAFVKSAFTPGPAK